MRASDGSVPLSGTAWQYTGNVTPVLRLFEQLSAMHAGQTVLYDTGYAVIKRWVQQYPQQNNNWGCFFEDISLPSNTEINAVTMASYIMEHPSWSASPLSDARSILDWTMSTLGSHAYDTIGVRAIYEQTVDLKEGGSHTSRFASAELLYSQLSGDTARLDQSIRQLNWATYLVDTSGQVRFSPQETTVWLTDGYGDYVRHFLRAMAAYPAIAPADADHLLGTTSVITHIEYAPQHIVYYTYDSSSIETLRLTGYPMQVLIDGVPAPRLYGPLSADGWQWTGYPGGGVVKVRHNAGRKIEITTFPAGIVEKKSDAPGLRVYPNPATDQLNVLLGTISNQEGTIELCDMTGRVVKVAQIGTAQKLVIPIQDLPSGIYAIRIQSNGDPMASSRFLKM